MNIDNEIENFEIVINKLKDILNIKSDRQLSFALDILPASFANSRKRGIIPFDKIINYALKKNIDLNLIFNPDVLIDSNTINSSNNKEDFLKIKILNNEEDFLKIPFSYNDIKLDTCRCLTLDDKIYIINIEDTSLQNNKKFILKSNNIYYYRHVNINFEGSFIFKDETSISEQIEKELVDKIEVVGKIIAILNMNFYY